MQSDEARRLRTAARNTPCDHPGVEAEYDLGGSTGDYSCTTCGKNFQSLEAWQRWRESQQPGGG